MPKCFVKLHPSAEIQVIKDDNKLQKSKVFENSVFLMVVLVLIPVLYSPLETLAAQISGQSGQQAAERSGIGSLLKRFSLLIILIVMTVEEFLLWVYLARLLHFSSGQFS